MRQAAHEVGLTSRGNRFVLVEVALLLRGLLVKMVALSRRTTHQLASARELKTLCYGFLGLLHDFRESEDKDT